MTLAVVEALNPNKHRKQYLLLSEQVIGVMEDALNFENIICICTLDPNFSKTVETFVITAGGVFLGCMCNSGEAVNSRRPHDTAGTDWTVRGGCWDEPRTHE